MLSLTPAPLSTDAERHLLDVLADLRVGNTALGGLAVFIPVVDGALQRRQADALIFLPETIVVVRVTGTGRQAGDLVLAEDRAWTVAGEPLRMSGGGSTPVPGLLKAVQMIGAQLREGGLDPGPLPTMSVVDGAIARVIVPAGGPVVSRMDAQDLTRVLRQCALRASDARVWTTADVRAALEVLGVYARIPSVEELNNEGFMYSPYVLRRTEPSMAHGPFLPPMAFLPAAEPAPSPASEPGGIAGLFDSLTTDERTGPEPAVRTRPERTGRFAALVAIVAVVSLLILVGLQVLSSNDSGSDGAVGTGPAATTAPESPAGGTQTVDGATYTMAAAKSDNDCAANSYGQVGDYFAGSPCTGLQRALFTTTIDGQGALVSLSVVSMPDEASAQALRALADADGTGNVSDLLRSGVVVPNTTAVLSDGAYASMVDGAIVRIVLVSWANPADAGDPATLDATADSALALQLPA